MYQVFVVGCAQRGAGPGLSVCRHIDRVHGGGIEVESQVGQGSTFCVFLPLCERSQPELYRRPCIEGGMIAESWNEVYHAGMM